MRYKSESTPIEYRTSKQRDNESDLQWVRRQLAESELEKPEHYQDTNTGLRGASYEQYVLPWEYFHAGTSSYQEGGLYRADLFQIYELLGIFEGNGEWYISAYHYDKTKSQTEIERWDGFVNAVLSHIDHSDFWEWDEESDEDEES